MSTLKTVLTTCFVLLLGAILLGEGSAVWTQQQEIQDLQVKVATLQEHVDVMQEQTDDTSVRLNKSIKTTNKNFSSMTRREDKTDEIVSIIAKLIISSSGQEPSSYKNPNQSGE